MAAGDGYADAQGIWQYGEADLETLMSDLLNLGQESVSQQLTLDRARLTALEPTSGTLTATAGYTVTSFTKLTKRAGLATLNWYISKPSGTFANGVQIATLPVGFRPASNVYANGLIYNGVTPQSAGGVVLLASGAVQMIVTSAVAGLDTVGSITYPAA